MHFETKKKEKSYEKFITEQTKVLIAVQLSKWQKNDFFSL